MKHLSVNSACMILTLVMASCSDGKSRNERPIPTVDQTSDRKQSPTIPPVNHSQKLATKWVGYPIGETIPKFSGRIRNGPSIPDYHDKWPAVISQSIEYDQVEAALIIGKDDIGKHDLVTKWFPRLVGERPTMTRQLRTNESIAVKNSFVIFDPINEQAIVDCGELASYLGPLKVGFAREQWLRIMGHPGTTATMFYINSDREAGHGWTTMSETGKNSTNSTHLKIAIPMLAEQAATLAKKKLMCSVLIEPTLPLHEYKEKWYAGAVLLAVRISTHKSIGSLQQEIDIIFDSSQQ